MSVPLTADASIRLRELLRPGVLAGVVREAAARHGSVLWLQPFASGLTVDRVTGTPDHYDVYLTAPGGSGTGLIAEVRSDDVAAAAAAIEGRLRKANRRQLRGDTLGAVPIPLFGVVLRPPGLDERIASLRILSEPRAAAPLIEPDDVGEVQSVELLGHRLHKRAVALVSGTGGRVVLKAYKARSDIPGRTAEFVAAAEARQSVRLWPEVRRSNTDPAVLIMEWVRGVVGSEFGPVAATRLEPIAATLSDFHRLPTDTLGFHGVAAEVLVLESAANLGQEVHPGVQRLILAALSNVAGRLGDVALAPIATIHRDAHPGQFTDTSCPVLLDLDTVSAGDPMLDLGNLAAHIRLTAGAQAAAHLVHTYAPTTHERFRLRAWTDAARLRLALMRLVLPDTHASALVELEALAR